MANATSLDATHKAHPVVRTKTVSKANAKTTRAKAQTPKHVPLTNSAVEQTDNVSNLVQMSDVQQAKPAQTENVVQILALQ
tara:strand:- start:2178 stop:2420 length:243 start_codon:yes stop_codon:yes gene_type:complete